MAFRDYILRLDSKTKAHHLAAEVVLFLKVETLTDFTPLLYLGTRHLTSSEVHFL